ncbi:MAG: putative cytokinetic ring protein SteA [Trebonia sp.]|uniref:putative cytokinetic ring protein SteA n=1 Tax=Trebonia sp. TaxID=2767075 RepID=UPI003BB21FF7
MKLPSVRIPRVGRGKAAEPPGTVGVARVDPRTKVLVKRLKPGDIAVIDHADLDRVSADELIDCRVAAVVNAAKSITGRYPNLGPRLLLEAGIPLLDDVGSDVLIRISEGAVVRLDGDVLFAGDQAVAKGVLQDETTLAKAMQQAVDGVTTQIDSFAANTLEFLRHEVDLLTTGIQVPELGTLMDGRHVLVVVRGYRYREDLRALRPYIREYRPVMLAVDGGADALLEAGYRPDVIIGDMDSVTDDALCSGAELVVHAYPDGHAPGLARLQSLGVDAVPLPAAGTSEDVALLVADACGASLIAVVGTHWTLEEFLDKGRPGMASTFLTHLRVGGKLVNARGVHQLYQSRISGWALLVLVLAAAFTLVIVVMFSPAGPILGNYFSVTWRTFTTWFTGLFT